jgi:DNA-directed RNA polymerase specialized sigma24 family protein
VKDVGELEALIDRVYEPTRRYALRRASPDEAEDAVSETMLLLWQQPERTPKGSEVGWSIGVCRKVLANMRRKRADVPHITGTHSFRVNIRQVLDAPSLAALERSDAKAKALAEKFRAESGESEEDRIDAKPIKAATPTKGVLDSLTAAQQQVVFDTATQVKDFIKENRPFDAFSLVDAGGLDAEEKIALWSLLDSAERSMMKRMGKSAKAVKTEPEAEDGV